MTTTRLTTKGQIVIPSKLRKRLHLKKGARLCVLEEGNKIILQPLTPDYFNRMAGIVTTRGKLTQTLLEERAKEKGREEKP